MTINTEMTVRVAAITQVADKVKRFRFERVDGQPMPIFSGGAHVVVGMRDGKVLRRNPYSLMSSPTRSRPAMKSACCGSSNRAAARPSCMRSSSLAISSPSASRSICFPSTMRGRKHIMMAGGIGITPFIAMMDQLDRARPEFRTALCRAHPQPWRLLARTGCEDTASIASRSIAMRKSSSSRLKPSSATSRSARISMSAALPA